MATYEWEYGAAGSGLHFTITYNDADGTFTVTSLEGSFDLNALWFSDGDLTSDGYALSKGDNSLNMNGSNEVWDGDGNASMEKITWDDYAKLSSPGLGTEGENKDSFIGDGDTAVFTLAHFGLDSFDPEIYTTLGVRATSVNGDGSIKWVDSEPEVQEENQAPTDLRLSIDAAFAAAAGGVDGPPHDASNMTIVAGAGGLVVGTLIVSDPDVGDTHTLTLVAGSDPRFEIVGNQLVLKAGQVIDTGDADFKVTVEVTDGVTSPYYETFSFHVGADKSGGGTNTGNADSLDGDDNAGAGISGDPTTGDDQILGFSQGDTLTGGSGDDALFGGQGDDSLIGDAGNDQLFGGAGNDTISDGAGNDLIIGGSGSDVINFAADGETDVLDYNALSEGGDTVSGFDTSAPNIGGAGGDFIDLSDLLVGFSGTVQDALDGGYLDLDDTNPDLLVRVDPDGGGNNYTTVVTIAGIGSGNEALVTDNIVVD
jgi:Ca2+-binding RTX toxin-like protein